MTSVMKYGRPSSTLYAATIWFRSIPVSPSLLDLECKDCISCNDPIDVVEECLVPEYRLFALDIVGKASSALERLLNLIKMRIRQCKVFFLLSK